MNCLLCSYKNNKKEELRKHYVKYHNVDQNNLFFQKVIDEKNKIIGKCGYCNKYVSNKVKHNFLTHYGKGFSIDDNSNSNADLDKPINITNIAGLKKIEIRFNEHSCFYDFFDSVAVVDSFLAQVKDVMKGNDKRVLIRTGFSIENIQEPLNDYSEPLLQTKYWSTEPLQTTFLNDFILFKIRESILKRVINNKLSGSAWNFNKFNYLNVKILDASYQLMR